MPEHSVADSYRRYRRQLIAARVPLTAQVVSAVTLLYALTQWVSVPERFRTEWLPNALQITVPLLAWLVVRWRTPARPELLVLGVELTYTTVMAARLYIPATVTQGVALYLAIKMMATAVFVPWGPWVQGVSSVITLVLYAIMMVASGRPGPTAGQFMQQGLGPLIAALLSVAGAASADRVRRSAFDREQELAEASARVRSLLESVPDGIFVVGDGHIVFSNAPLAAMLGYGAPAALVGRQLSDLVDPTHQVAVREYLAGVAATPGAGKRLEAVFLSARGSPLEVSLTAAALRSQTRPGVQVMVRDITERKRAEQALAQEAEVSAALALVGRELIALPEARRILDRLCRLTTHVLHCDASHTFLWQEKGQVYEAVAGYGDTREEWEAIRLLRFPPAEKLQGALERAEWWQVTQEDTRDLVSVELLRQFDRSAVLGVSLRRADKIVGVLTSEYRKRTEPFTAQQLRTARGIAHLASLALESARLVEELERADRLKSEFVATMSHELRTPLNVIIGYHELLAEGAFGTLTPEQAEAVGRAARSARELFDLVNATLDLSRLEARRITLHVEEVALADLAAEVAAELRSTQDARGLKFGLDVSPDVPVLQTDRVKLKMVLKNLLGNAIKFTQQGGVTLTAHARDSGVEICVCDTGVGIPPDAQGVIFEAFRQLHAQQHGGTGAGLGLYIVSRLLEVLGGRIAVESEVGRGSVFRVWLPLQASQPSSRPESTTEAPRTSSPTTEQ